MDTDRIEAMLRVRPPGEGRYERQLPALVGTSRPVPVRLRTVSDRSPRRTAAVLAGILALVALLVVAGIWLQPQKTSTAGSTATPSSAASPTLGRFVPTGSLSTARLYASATLLADGRVLVAGGMVSGGVTDTAEIYDPATGEFSPTGSMTVDRYGQTAVRLPSGGVLIAGGFGVEDGGFKPRTSAEVYDPATSTFKVTGSMVVARAGPAVTMLADGRVLFAGGATDGQLSVVLASAEIYDPATGSFAATGSLAQARYGGTATLLEDGRVLVAGGQIPNPGNEINPMTPLASAELFNPATGTFAPAGSMTEARVGHTATRLADGRVLIAAGQNQTGTIEEAEVYNPATDSFSATGSMLASRTNPAAFMLHDGRVLFVGGNQLDADVELYDPPSGAFVSAGYLQPKRSGFASVALLDGRVLLAGGWLVTSSTGRPTWTTSCELFEP